MERELKFRAWDGSRMIEFSDMSIGFKKGKKTVPYVYFEKDSFNGQVSLRQHEIMQYTGLKDKNGKEIYEGDICKTRDSILQDDDVFDDLLICNDFHTFLYEVLYSEAHSGIWGYAQNNLEVIGNIYENPFLLK